MNGEYHKIRGPEPIAIIFEDNHLLVVEKPRNIPAQADRTNDPDMLTLLKSDLKSRYNKPGNVFLGLVHRLDRPVGGVMVFAKTSKAASRLSGQIRQRAFHKIYLAVVHGCPQPRSGTLESYLIKDTQTNTVKTAGSDANGARHALLNYSVKREGADLSLVRIDLHTGRPHQIRVQFAEIGCPLHGDGKYGPERIEAGRHIALWSHELCFMHPTRGESVSFTSNPPKGFPWTAV